jgi:hypothetical protein
MDIHKEIGDEGEAYVNELASGTYLKYWCYANPKDEAGDYKEFCDLLILFRDTAIIISVKNHHYDGNPDKYRKKVIDKSTSQLNGAYRKLFENNKDIYIKHPDREEELFVRANYKHIFRITINVGEQFENYALSDQVAGKGFINILNKDTFEAIIDELDTVNDLTDYLIKREALLLKKVETSHNCREKDLLALFVTNAREFPVSTDAAGKLLILGCAGAWDKYKISEAYYYKQTHDSSSYFIDKMVAREVLPLQDGEVLARELMNTTRFERRLLAKDLFSLVEKYQYSQPEILARRYHVHNDIGYLIMYYGSEIPQKQIDEIVKLAAEVYAYQYQQKEVVVIAATDELKQYKFGLFRSFDAPPTPEAIGFLNKFIKQFGWFQNEQKIEIRETEFPDHNKA